MESFDEDRADFFFGRETEVNAALHLLGSQPGRYVRWLQVEGVSGSGKSSFARAGLVPKVRLGWIGGAPRAWRVAVVKPGTQPLLGLAHAVHHALSPAQVSLEAFLQELHKSPTALASFLRQHTPPGHGVLLLVDQFEELFTLSALESARAFDKLLATALEDTDGPLHLLTTIRGDFLGRFKELPALETLRGGHAAHYRLERMRPLALQAAIQQPARKVGLSWEPGLPETLLEDISELEAGLPLLAHVLSELWARRQGKTLTSEAYKSLGGISGALTRSADSLIASLGEEGTHARSLLLALATRQGGILSRRSLSRTEALVVAGGGPRAEQLLARLSGGRGPNQPETVAAPPRLLVVTQSAGVERVDLVHEALLTRWATFNRWLEEERPTLERRDELEAMARVWHASGAVKSALPLGRQLAYLHTASPVTQLGREFLHRAGANAIRYRKLVVYTYTFVAFVVIGTATGLTVMYQRYQQTEQVRQAALEKNRVVTGFLKRLDQAGALSKLGEASRQKGRLDEARGHFQQALELLWELRKSEASIVEFEGTILSSSALHDNLHKLGSVAQAQGRLDEARGLVQQALDISKTLARADGSAAGFQMNCVQDELTLSDLAFAGQDLEASRTHRANAKELLDQLLKTRAVEAGNVRYMGLRAWLSAEPRPPEPTP